MEKFDYGYRCQRFSEEAYYRIAQVYRAEDAVLATECKCGAVRFLKENMKRQKSETALSKNSETNPPIINGVALIDGASENYKNTFFAKLNISSKKKANREEKARSKFYSNKNLDDHVVENLVDARVEGMSAEDVKKMVSYIILQHTDNTSALKIFYFKDGKPYSKDILNLVKPEYRKDWRNQWRKLKAVMDYRNSTDSIPHGDGKARNTYTEQKTLDYFDIFQQAADLLDPGRFNDEVRNDLKEFYEYINDKKKMFSYPPISKQELESIKGFDWKEFNRDYRVSQNYDQNAGILYWADINEMKRQYASMQANRDAVKEVSGRTAGISFTTAFPKMAAYNGLFINEAQMNELAAKAVIMADPAFWMNDMNRQILGARFVKRVKKNGQKIVVDWETRDKLRTIAKDSFREFDINTRKQAEHALNTIKLLSENQCVYELKKSVPLASSAHERMTDLAWANSDVMFVFLTNDEDFIKEMDKKELSNVIPAYFRYANADKKTASDRLAIYPSASGFFKRVFSQQTVQTEADDEENIKSDSSEAEQAPAETGSIEKPKPEDVPAQTVSEQKTEPVTVESEPKAEPVSVEAVAVKTSPVKTPPAKVTPVKAKPAANARKLKYKLKLEAAHPDQCMKEDGRRLIVDHVPAENEFVWTNDGRKIQLLKAFGRGGEGIVYQTDINQKVAKIYYEEKLTEYRLNKLTLLMNKHLSIDKVCLPEALLYNEKQQFVGFLMRSAAGYKNFSESILQLNNPDIAAQMKWNRYSLITLCLSLCNTVKQLHEAGIYIGDINPNNMMINYADPSVFDDFVLVDCDSYQIDNYPCPVGTDLYTSPAIFERMKRNGESKVEYGEFLRTEEDEDYALASMLFRIIMLNKSPFEGKGTTDINQAKMNYNFAYRITKNGEAEGENSGKDTPSGFPRMVWNNTDWQVKNLFAEEFKDGKDVVLDKWINAFSHYKKGIESNEYTKELKPVLYWDKPGEHYNETFVCDMCHQTRNMPVQRYERLKKTHQPLLCNECTTAAEEAKQETSAYKAVCIKCGKSYEVSKYTRWEIDNEFRDPICPECGKYVPVICSGCGRKFNAKKYKVDEANEKRRGIIFCSDCMEPTTARCEKCGRTFNLPIGKTYLLQAQNRRPICPDCMQKRIKRR